MVDIALFIILLPLVFIVSGWIGTKLGTFAFKLYEKFMESQGKDAQRRDVTRQIPTQYFLDTSVPMNDRDPSENLGDSAKFERYLQYRKKRTTSLLLSILRYTELGRSKEVYRA